MEMHVRLSQREWALWYETVRRRLQIMIISSVSYYEDNDKTLTAFLFQFPHESEYIIFQLTVFPIFICTVTVCSRKKEKDILKCQ